MLRILLLTAFCCAGVSFAADHKDVYNNCAEAVTTTGREGVHKLQLHSSIYYADCIIGESGTEAWTIIQRRIDGTVNFNRSLNDYKYGFGNIAEEYFIGLDRLYDLTHSTLHELWIRLETWDNEYRYAIYSLFAIGNSAQDYAIILLGDYNGTAGDSLRYEAGSKFSTYDKDHDESLLENCAKLYASGWWFKQCEDSNLNGLYYKNGKYKAAFSNGINWKTYRGYWYSYKSAHMAIRPVKSN